MSEEKKEEAPAQSAPKAPRGPLLPTILILANTTVIAAALGVLVYSRILFHRPAITEASALRRLEQRSAQRPSETGLVNFDPVTVNIASDPQGRSRYVTIGFSLEIRDKTRVNDVESVRPVIMDRFLQLVGRKHYPELNNVQGRYVLRTELIEATNQVIFQDAGRIRLDPSSIPQPASGEEGKAPPSASPSPAQALAGTPGSGEPRTPIRDLVTNVYFTQFVVQ